MVTNNIDCLEWYAKSHLSIIGLIKEQLPPNLWDWWIVSLRENVVTKKKHQSGWAEDTEKDLLVKI